MATKANLFQTEKDTSATQNIMDSMGVYIEDDKKSPLLGETVVSFATNRGKGSGAQKMRVSDFGEYLITLEEFVENGIEEIADKDNLSPAETVRETISCGLPKDKDGNVIEDSEEEISFRVRSGKGAKPAKIPASEFGEVVALLRSVYGNVQKLSVQVEEAAEAAEAAKAAEGTPEGDNTASE